MFEPYLMGQYQYPLQGMAPMSNWQPQTPQDRFYLKETDMTGVSTVSEFEFKKVEAETPQEYVTRQEFEQFSAQLSTQLKEQYESVIQHAGQFQQPAQAQPRVDPAAIPSVSTPPRLPLGTIRTSTLIRADAEPRSKLLPSIFGSLGRRGRKSSPPGVKGAHNEC